MIPTPPASGGTIPWRAELQCFSATKFLVALGWLLFTTILAGCQSIGFSYYSSPRVTGHILAADTRQPLPGVTVKRVVPYATAGESTPPKGAQLLTLPPGVQTDAAGGFVLDEVRVVTLFRRGSWHVVTVSFACAGYRGFETNFTATSFRARSPEGVPLVNAGDILLQPGAQ